MAVLRETVRQVLNVRTIILVPSWITPLWIHLITLFKILPRSDNDHHAQIISIDLQPPELAPTNNFLTEVTDYNLKRLAWKSDKIPEIMAQTYLLANDAVKS